MIEHLDALLRHLLLVRLPALLPAFENVRFEPPNSAFPALVNHATGTVANVYLLDVRENRRLRSTERRLDPVTRQWVLAPHRVDCHYLITAWIGASANSVVDPTIEEHRLLAEIAKVLLDEGALSFARVLPADDLDDLPRELQEVELPIAVGPGEGFSKLAEFWGTMGASAPWRPAVYLVVTVPMMRLPEVEPGPPVEAIVTSVGVRGSVDSVEDVVDIGGTVLSSAGRPVPDAWVALLTAAGRRLETQRTDSDGRFRFAGMPPGDYRLSARAAGHPVPTQTTPVHAPAPAAGAYQLVLA